MRWSPLPRGPCTGIDWSRAAALDGVDPYLVWAEASRFAACAPTDLPTWLPILLELAEPVSIDDLVRTASPRWLRIPPAYRSRLLPSGLRFCSAHVRREFFDQIQPGGRLHAMVRRFELGLPAGHHDTPVWRAIDPGRTEPARLLKGKFIAVIDAGVAFANLALLRQGRARTRRFWCQDASGVGVRPVGLAFGHELRAADIDRALAEHRHGGLVDEDALYRQLGLWQLRRRVSHGTHVADLACGSRLLRRHDEADFGDDPAGRADLLAVQLEQPKLADAAGGSMNVSIMDALVYLLTRCTLDSKLVVNISWGTLAGPHDGSSVLEAAMDQLIDLRAGRLQIVVPAGNGYQSRTHANATLAPGASMRLNWRIPPDDATPSFLEIWLAPGADAITIGVTPAGGRPPLAPMKIGQAGICHDASGRPMCALIYPRRVATGNHGTCALLALAPTFSFQQSVATAPSGLWQVRLVNHGTDPACLDAYIERDDVALGQPSGARQSYFEDHLYDSSGNPGSWVDVATEPDQPHTATLIRRSGAFNSIATGRNTRSVGARLPGLGRWARYSPQRPDPDPKRAQRPQVVKAPSDEAVCERVDGLAGLRAAGSRSAGSVRLSGSSAAAPQVARAIFNALP